MRSPDVVVSRDQGKNHFRVANREAMSVIARAAGCRLHRLCRCRPKFGRNRCSSVRGVAADKPVQLLAP
jgi:hypothetical protein